MLRMMMLAVAIALIGGRPASQLESRAVLAVECLVPKKVYEPGEPIVAVVRIKNRGASSLLLFPYAYELIHAEIRATHGSMVRENRTDKGPSSDIAVGRILQAGRAIERILVLDEWVKMDDSGRWQVIITVKAASGTKRQCPPMKTVLEKQVTLVRRRYRDTGRFARSLAAVRRKAENMEVSGAPWIHALSFFEDRSVEGVLVRISNSERDYGRESRHAAIRGLRRFQSRNASETLIKLISRSKDELTRCTAVLSLEAQRSEYSDRMLAGLCDDRNAEIRKVVRRRMEEIDNDWATAVLNRMNKRAEDPR